MRINASLISGLSYPEGIAVTSAAAPLPAAVWPGLLTLAGMAMAGGLRKLRQGNINAH